MINKLKSEREDINMELFDPHNQQWLKTKFEHLKYLRENEPVWFSEKYNMWIVTKHSLVHECLMTPEVFSSSKGNQVMEQEHRMGKSLGSCDNPRHENMQKTIRPYYANLTAFKELVDSVDMTLSKDIGDDINRIVCEVSAKMMGLPFDIKETMEAIDHVQRYAHQLAYFGGDFDVQYRGECTEKHSQKGFETLQTLLRSVLPSHEVPYGLYKVVKQNGAPFPMVISHPALNGASGLMGAITAITVLLCNNPELYQEVKNKPDLNDADIKEMLRYTSTSARLRRVLLSDYTLGGVNLNAGDLVVVCNDAANHDEEVFENADSVIFGRSIPESMAFGKGVHACLAQNISSHLILRFVQTLIATFDTLELVDKYPDYRLTYPVVTDIIEPDNLKLI